MTDKSGKTLHRPCPCPTIQTRTQSRAVFSQIDSFTSTNEHARARTLTSAFECAHIHTIAVFVHHRRILCTDEMQCQQQRQHY